MAGKGGGGAWKVAYADFVTAMMAFFLVMWITSQGTEVKQSIAGYFQDPWGTSSEHSAPRFQIPGALHRDIPGGVPPSRMPGRVPDPNAKPTDPKAASAWEQRKVLLSNADRTLPALLVPFEEASAEVSDSAKSQLRSLVPSLVGKSNKIEIRAHSTRRPLPPDSPFADHWALCYARALATMDYLVEQGIEPGRMRLSQSGAHDRLARRLETGWQSENSCVEIFLLGEMVDDVPGTDDRPREPGRAAASHAAAAAN